MHPKAMINHNGFARFILGVILFNAILIGISTYHSSPIVHTLEWICIWVFVAEIALKFYARESSRQFFANGWNIFDIVVVGSAFVPNISTMATLLRVLRVFRVLRLVDGLPELRLIVTVLIKSVHSMFYIALLMFITFYIYAVLGVDLFSAYLPNEFGTLHESFVTLFRILTLDDWAALRRASMEHGNYWVATGYFTTWIAISAFLMVNLVVGAVLNNYQEVHDSQKAEKIEDDQIDARIAELGKEIAELAQRRAGRM